MTNRIHENNAATTLDGPITDVATSITVDDASVFPTLGVNDTIHLTIFDGIAVEIVIVTDVSGNVLTVTRGAENTSASAFADATEIELRPTADGFDRKADRSPVFSNLVTGLLTGGIITVNSGDNSKWDMSAWSAFVIDYTTVGTVDSPIITYITGDALVAQTVPDLATSSSSRVFADDTGTVQIDDTLTSASIVDRTIVRFGILFHPDNATISAVEDSADQAYGHRGSFNDFVDSFGAINLSGNLYTANGANLSVDKSEGSAFLLASNYNVDMEFPDVSTNPAKVTADIIYRYSDGAGGRIEDPIVTVIDPDQYDDGTGTLAAVPNNKFTAQPISYGIRTQKTFVLYGQHVYDTMDEALQGIVFDSEDSFGADALKRSWLIIKKGTTDLTDTGDAVFIERAAISGLRGSSSTSLAAATLQSAYDSSTDPEIVLDDTKGGPAVSITDSSTPVSGNLFEVEDNGRTLDYFAVSTATAVFGVDVDLGTNYIDIGEISTPANPAANSGRLYTKDDASVTTLYFRDSAGTETDLLAGGGGGGDPDQNLWETITADTGSATANTITDSFALTGGTGIDTTISGDACTIGMDIDGLTTSSDVAFFTGDMVVFYDTSVGSERKMEVEIWQYELISQSADITTSLDIVSDYIPLADTSVFQPKKVTPANLVETVIDNATGATIAAGDTIVFGDTSDSENIKSDTVQGILDLVTGGGDMVLADVQTNTGAKSFDSGTMILKGSVSGTTVINSAAIAGTSTLTFPSGTAGILSTDSTDTLTNKTVDADGTGNVITNIGSSEVKSELISGQTEVVVAAGDSIIFGDSSDSGNLKRDTVQGIIDLAGGTDNTSELIGAGKSGVQSITSATWTKVVLDTELFDLNSSFDSTTNYRWTPTIAGKYWIGGRCLVATPADQVLMICAVYKNGSVYIEGIQPPSGSANVIPMCTGIVDMNGSTDYLELWIYQASGGNRNTGDLYADVALEGFLIG